MGIFRVVIVRIKMNTCFGKDLNPHASCTSQSVIKGGQEEIPLWAAYSITAYCWPLLEMGYQTRWIMGQFYNFCVPSLSKKQQSFCFFLLPHSP